MGTPVGPRASPLVIDLNADLGEDVGNDTALLEIVTSANIACGFHAGSEATMREVCRLAVGRGVVLGAHVSYRDSTNFGRRPVTVTPAQLAEDVTEQIVTLRRVAAEVGGEVRYVKPHGALYNVAAVDPVESGAVVAALADVDSSLVLLGLPNSQLQRAAADRRIRFVAEAFADRAYLPSGELVPRSEPHAVHHDPYTAVAQALGLAREHAVIANDGSTLHVVARSLCVHGDNPAAVTVARQIRSGLVAAGLALAAFA
ncbi:MAG TPA: 5-oxoprolinase subunit PxpA [Jatrophihabitans sp.]|jgi:UPF0271 protein